MKISRPTRTLLRPFAGCIAGLLTVGALSIASAPAAFATPAASAASAATTSAADSSVVASGDGWTVTQGAGGYLVSLTLDAPLPVKDDVPELFADGTDLGPAAESADGRTLTIATPDTSVATAKKITWQWSSGGSSTAVGPTTLPSASAQAKAQRKLTSQAVPNEIGGSGTTSDDPTTIGTGGYTIADYNFGAQSVPLADIGGIRGELEGRVYVPTDKKPHPLVVFLHGRHSSCYNTTTLRGASGWPCPAGTTPILSYAGYDAAAEALAADGYTVVSVSANAINANDNQLSPDDGAITRGQLVLDTLTMLKKVNAGEPVSYHDAATDQDVTFDQALTAGRSTYPAGTLSATSLAGTMDFSKIGLMGHSRGGEGVVTAGTLNEALPEPWNIKSVFPLAPIDFTRTTLPDVMTTTLLPYCDGDVSDQQGQHFFADSRDAFSDNVLRSNLWVMGTDHNFFNSAWTPPSPAASDDWSAADDAVCGTSAKALASGKNIRLTAAQEYQVGAAYISGFFESTLGGQSQFDGMFDGSQELPPSVADFADVRTVAQQPSSKRSDITSFKTISPLIGTTSAATATVCANKYGRTVPEPYPYCTNPGSTLSNQQVPHWTPASFAPNVPLNVMTHLTWTAATGALGVTLPAAKQNVSAYSELTVSMSPDESVTAGTDMTLGVTDSAGHKWTGLVSELNKWGVTRMPASGTSTNLGKIVLQQVSVPTATLAAAGLDLKHVTNVSFTAAVGVDGVPTGGVYLSDLGFDNKGLGTASVHTRPTVNVAPSTAEEGNGPGADQVAVYLSKPSTTPVSAYFTAIGSATGKVGLAMQKVTFDPGTTCQVLDIPVSGDTTAGTTASTAYKLGVSNSTEAVLGSHDFGTMTVREDDGVTGTATAAPPVGVQGDVCAEHKALAHPGTLTADDTKPAPGGTVTLGGAGYRDGESVAFSIGSTVLGSAIAGPDGTVSFPAVIPADQPFGAATISAVGAGSGFTESAGIAVLATTATTLTLEPAAPKIGQSVTLKAAVTGGVDGTTVTFADGTKALGTAKLSGGTASLKVKAGFQAGTHAFTAALAATPTTDASVSDTVQLVLTKGQSSIAMALSAKSASYGHAVSGVFSVAGASGGTVTVNYGTGKLSAKLGASGAGKFTLPATLSVGAHTVSVRYDGSDSVDPSGTASQKLTVAKAKSSVTLTLSKTKLARGKSETVKVTVGGHSAGAYPTGTVTVTAKVGGTTTTHKVTLKAGAKGKLSFSITLPKKKGTASVTASYGGDANFTASTSAHKQVKLT